MPFPYLGENQQLDETTRRAGPGAFIQLPGGATHYELGGDPQGPVVTLVHGFSVPCFIFDPTFEFLAASGFRVLRYDLFGRGWSDRPHVPNDLDLFVRQLHDLVEALQLRTPIALVGLSMGGPISAAYTVRYPESVAANILIDPAGTRPIPLGMLGLLAKPLIGEFALGIFGGEQLIKNIASDFFDQAQVEHFQVRYRTQMQFAGFKRSILSTIRSGMLGNLSETYRLLGHLHKPLLLIWGREDRTVPFAHSQQLLQLLPQAEFHVIEHSSHIPHYENPEQVNPLLRSFLDRVFSI